MRFFCLVLGLMSSFALSAQVLPYLFQIDNQPYSQLDNPVSITGNDNWQDPDYLIDIGFDFYGFGQWNNQMTFGGVFGYGGELFFGAFDGTQVYNHVCPYGLDIEDPNFGTNSPPSGHILMQVDGTAPNRICKIEWRNVGFYLDQTGTMRTNFQLWLYETSNTIEYRYGPSENFSIEPLLELNGILVGLSSNFDFNTFAFSYLWALNGAPEDPSITYYDSFSLDFQVADQITNQPAENTVYRFVNLEINVSEQSNSSWSVYPCPADETLNVAFFENGDAKSYSIYDVAGSLVGQAKISGRHNEIDISHLPAGLYALNVQGVQGMWQKHFTIE